MRAAMLAGLQPVGPGVAVFGVVKQPPDEMNLEHGHRCKNMHTLSGSVERTSIKALSSHVDTIA